MAGFVSSCDANFLTIDRAPQSRSHTIKSNPEISIPIPASWSKSQTAVLKLWAGFNAAGWGEGQSTLWKCVQPQIIEFSITCGTAKHDNKLSYSIYVLGQVKLNTYAVNFSLVGTMRRSAAPSRSVMQSKKLHFQAPFATQPTPNGRTVPCNAIAECMVIHSHSCH